MQIPEDLPRARRTAQTSIRRQPAPVTGLLVALVAWALSLATPAAKVFAGTNSHTEWIILTSGEKFQTDRSWREDGRLKFRLNGLVVSVPEGDVAKVVVPGAAASTASGSVDPSPSVSAAQNRREPMTESPSTPQDRLQNALRLPPPGAAVKPKRGQWSKATPKIEPQTSPAPMTAKRDPTATKSPQTVPTEGVFRNLGWGMRPSSMPGLLLSQTNPAYGGVDEFFYPDEELQLGKAPLNGIVYGFWQNRLYTITIWTDGRPSYEKLRQWVFDTYGAGRQSDSSVERRIWHGDGTDRLLEFDEALNTGIYWMRSTQLHARIKQMQAP